MAIDATKKRQQQKRQAIVRLALMAAILVCINILAAYFNLSIDLTKEKRFTLSKATKSMLHKMDDVAVVTVYLKGDIPADFKRLAEVTRERLQSFKSIAGSHIVYRFEDPVGGKTEAQKEKQFKEFAEEGVSAFNYKEVNEGESYTQKLVFPWAVIQYKGKTAVVNLLENHMGMSDYQNLSYSESLLEYKLANAIHKLSLPDKFRLAYIMGNGEMLGPNTFDALTSLGKLYHLDTISLKYGINISLAYDAIIINKPREAFDDKEKYKIDQYVMHGGHVLWYLDMVNTPMDSLNHSQEFLAMSYNLNLDDILFKYGVRVNPDLVEDMTCAPIPVTVGMNNNNQPQIELHRWMFYPVLVPHSNHPIVNNLNAILSQFANSIDTLDVPGIKKTVLLQSSKYSRVEMTPVRVSLGMLRYPLREDLFRQPFQNIAVLLEGKFQSVFNNRLSPDVLHMLNDSLKQPFMGQCDSSNSMIVVADGDMMLNDYTQQGPMEMGYYKFTQSRFDNKDFLLNCIEYLTDKHSLLTARAKMSRLRLLDPKRVDEEKTEWQFVNIGIPILLVLLFASGYIFFRRRRYEKKEITKTKE